MIQAILSIGDLERVVAAPKQSRWYKNCISVRRRGGKICEECPFRSLIEHTEKVLKDRRSDGR